jgi:hypothetical protein
MSSLLLLLLLLMMMMMMMMSIMPTMICRLLSFLRGVVGEVRR